MELSEFFKEHSIEDISKKTNIPKEKLESLREKKWEDFRKPQVIGFLNILQREYKVDLSDEINEAKEYFQEHQVERAVASIDMVDSTVLNEDKGYFITKLIYLLTIIALAYAGWYYYNREVQPQKQLQESNSSIISDTINSVKNLLGMDSSKIVQSTIATEVQKEHKSIPANIEKNKTDMLVKEVNNSSNKEENKSLLAQQEGINTTKEPKENKKFDIVNSEENQTQNSFTLEQENKEETNSIKQAVDTLLEENDSLKQATEHNTTQELTLQDSNLSENNGTLEENSTTINETNQTEQLQEENITLEESNISTTVAKSATIASTAKKLWIGIYNLDTKKRETKVIERKEPIRLDLNSGDYAVVTGHNKVEVSIGDEKRSFPKKGKVYFLLSKEEGLKILTKEEYRKVTKRRAW